MTSPHDASPPPFRSLLQSPLLEVPLPQDFDVGEEATHLEALWKQTPRLQAYQYQAFVHAGGSGMVFQVSEQGGPSRALKVVRRRLYYREVKDSAAATNLSPVSEAELKALERVSHPNVVRLYEAIEDEKGVIAICTSYVEGPRSLDAYLRETLEKEPGPRRRRGRHSFSPERLEKASDFLVERCLEISQALVHLHSLDMYHFDVKPANILVATSGPSKHRSTLTDLGSCIHGEFLRSKGRLRVHFTWTYAHPDLKTIIHDPGSISGGGLKASASISAQDQLAKYDLFALGKSIQELLAVFEREFGERCHGSFGFRFLHLVACLLLDGRNVAPTSDVDGSQVIEADGRRFVVDVALGYPPGLFRSVRITSAEQLVERLGRYGREFSGQSLAPELNPWLPEVMNSVVHAPAPFSARVAAVLTHPAMKRLRDEPQLGWMKDVFPGATHDRWTHSVGVFSALVGYYNALLADPEIPTVRVVIESSDVSHGFVAALLHDIGQTTFGHDFEEACGFLFSHENIVARLLKEECWGKPTLEDTLRNHWPEVAIPRVIAILKSNGSQPSGSAGPVLPIDGIASDAINGPIDADKLDYLLRDSVSCGVPYGMGIDVARFLRALTVSARSDDSGVRFALAYKAKGRASIASVLLTRYQLYGAVYWHHTFRCIQAMFVHAAGATFAALEHGPIKCRHGIITAEVVRELFYHRVICGKAWEHALTATARAPRLNKSTAPPAVSRERALEFVWIFADDSTRELLEHLAERKLHKRVFELRLGELGDRADYSAAKSAATVERRLSIARELKTALMDAIQNVMRDRGPVESQSEKAALLQVQALRESSEPLLVLDFPIRGVPLDLNTPLEMGDAIRKYSVLPRRGLPPQDNLFHVVRKLQEHLATLRVYAAPELHEIVIRYLNPEQIRSVVESLVSVIKRG